MNQEKKETIWITGKSIHTNNISSWNKVEKKLKSPLHVELDITKRQFLELIGDVTAENIILNNPLIEERDVLAKIRKFLTWKFNQKLPGESPEDEKKINDELNKQLLITKSEKFTIIGKINNINNIFKKEGLEENIYEKKGHQFRLLFFSFTGPEKIKVEEICPKERIILFGPDDPHIIEFCDKTSFYFNRKRWNSVRDRFFEIVVEKKQMNTPAYFIPIDRYLERYIKNEPKFFRKRGPLWCDLENGFVVERDEIKEIIDGFEKYQFQLLMGEAASGKTTIVASMGYKLVKEGWDVNILSSKSFNFSNVSDIINKMDFFNPEIENSLIIIDDFHKNAPELIHILKHMTPKKSRILLVTRNSYKINLQQEEIEFLDRFKAKELKKENFSRVADNLIDMIKKNGDDVRKKNFKKLNDKHIIEIKQEANGNLWILAYLLEAWSPDKAIDIGLVYDKIKKDINDLDIEFRRSKQYLIGVWDALMSLAPFSMFEIGVSKYFFNEKDGIIKIDSRTLEKLIEYGEILDENNYYFIPHSTPAELYLKTAMIKKYEDSLFYITRQLENRGFSGYIKDYPSEIIKAYIQINPKDFTKLISNIGSYLWDLYAFRSDRKLKKLVTFPINLKKIFKDKKTSLSLIKYLHKDNFQGIVYFLNGINLMIEMPKKIEELNLSIPNSLLISIKDFKTIFEKMSAREIASLLENSLDLIPVDDFLSLARINKDVKFYKDVINKINLLNLTSHLKNREYNLGDICVIMSRLYFFRKDVLNHYKELIIHHSNKNIDIKLSSYNTAFLFLEKIKGNDGEILWECLFDNINSEKLFSKIVKDSVSRDIIGTFPYLKRLIIKDEKYIQPIIHILKKEIKKREPPEKTSLFLYRVRELGDDFYNRFISQIEPTMLKNKG